MSIGNKNTALKRIHADVRELEKTPSDQYCAAPLEDNAFEWHFTIRGPPGTDFANGLYHGRIMLPADYPFKPPSIIFLTPNGRFAVGAKICLSISAHHPEHWQPAWGVRLILEALISFLPTEAAGALGSLDWSPQERKRLAAASQDWVCPKCGVLRDVIPPLRTSHPGSGAQNPYAEQLRALHIHGQRDDDVDAGRKGNAGVTAETSGEPERSTPVAGVEGNTDSTAVVQDQPSTSSPVPVRQQAPEAGAAETSPVAVALEPGPEEPDLLMYLAVAIVAAIVAILLRKVLRHFGQVE